LENGLYARMPKGGGEAKMRRYLVNLVGKKFRLFSKKNTELGTWGGGEKMSGGATEQNSFRNQEK